MDDNDIISMIYEKYRIYRGKKAKENHTSSITYYPPSVQEIISIQKQQIANFHNRLTKDQLNTIKEIITAANANSAEFQNTITKTLDDIEKWAASLWKNPDYKKGNIDLQSAEHQMELYKKLLTEWKKILKYLEIGESVNKQAGAQVTKFRQAVIDLENALKNKEPVSPKIISRAQSAAAYAKGYYLEQAGKDFYSKIFESLNVSVVATGQMKSVREGSSTPVDLASDLVITSKSAAYNGLTLQQFLQRVDNHEKEKAIVLNNDELGLIGQGISIQAKASRDKTVRIHNTAISAKNWAKFGMESGDTHGLVLQSLINDIDDNNIIYKIHPDYTLMANYVFSKQLSKQLHDNYLYLLKDGLHDTYSMLEQQLKKNNYVRILNNEMHRIKGTTSAIGIRLI